MKGTTFLSMVVIVTHIPQIMSSEYEIFRCTLLVLGNSSECLDRLLLYIIYKPLLPNKPDMQGKELNDIFMKVLH